MKLYSRNDPTTLPWITLLFVVFVSFLPQAAQASAYNQLVEPSGVTGDPKAQVKQQGITKDPSCSQDCQLEAANTAQRVYIPLARTIAATVTVGGGSIFRTTVKPLPGEKFTEPSAQFVIWLPNGVTTLRGVYMDAMCGFTFGGDAPNQETQQFAQKWDLGVVMMSGVCNANTGGARALAQAQSDVAAASKHPEFAQAPLVLVGRSISTQFVGTMIAYYPERVAAAFQRAGSEMKTYVPAAKEVPVMLSCGERDSFLYACTVAFDAYRPNDAVCSLAITPNEGHVVGKSMVMARIFFDAVLAQRLPAPGATSTALRPLDRSRAWLGNNQTHEVAPIAEYQGDPLKASWLPDETTARKWKEYVATAQVTP